MDIQKVSDNAIAELKDAHQALHDSNLIVPFRIAAKILRSKWAQRILLSVMTIGLGMVGYRFVTGREPDAPSLPPPSTPDFPISDEVSSVSELWND